MSRRYTISTGTHTVIVTDKQTGGVLTIRNNLTKTPDEFDENPIIDFANDLNSRIRDRSLVLELVGEDNEFIFNDSNYPILSGFIVLNGAKVTGPELNNVNLRDVNISTPITQISYSTLNGFSYSGDHLLRLSHCFVNSAYPITPSKEHYEFLSNKDVTNTIW